MSMRHNHGGHCAHSTPEAVQVRVSFTPVGRPRTGGVDGSKMKSCFCASSSPSSAPANVRQRSVCKECGGSGICEHGRQRYNCKECGGGGICEHGRRRSSCWECEEEAPGDRDIESIYAAALRKLARDQKREKRERDQ